jgi:anti-sigma factor RsiW
MSDSEKMQEEVYNYLDGLLSGQNRKLVEQKLQSDPEYRSFFADAKALRSNLKSLPGLKTSADFDTILRTRIKIERSLSRRRSFLTLPRFAPVYVAAAALLALAVFVSPRFNQQPTQPAVTLGPQTTQIAEQPSAPKVNAQATPAMNFPTDLIGTSSRNAVGLPARRNNANLTQFLTDTTAARRNALVPEQNNQIRTVNQVQEF